MTKTGWNFDNSYARLPGLFYNAVMPTAAEAPELVVFNEPLARLLGLDADKLVTEGAEIFSGNNIPEGAEPLAQAYAGHQFGYFTMLGDGRAILLGEQMTPDGKRVDIQLKGAGRTPYSRGGDGRAALGPMLREYIISEAMHGLGIPTTRSLAVVNTGEEVVREEMLPGAVLTRIADSHLRVGTFEYVARFGKTEDIRMLADYAIKRHYPQVENVDNRYLAFLQEVISRQASLIAKWQLVGFIHGVMNTDNMTISGETIDYGPCAFMDTYDPATVFSSIDHQGRYAYGNQPYIAVWNLARLAESLVPLIHEEQEEAIKLAENALSKFPSLFESQMLAGYRAKLGILNEEEKDQVLVDELLELMQKQKADYTNTFRGLTLQRMESTPLSGKEFKHWYEKWQARLERQERTKEAIQAQMKASNPTVIPRNHRVEEALAAAMDGNNAVMEKLLHILSNPYAYEAAQEEYCTLPDKPDEPYKTYCGT
ncbi:YdiU family protein [Bacillus sp. AGMB 02131]|uniref:Protein nucleotidyltransferase YdiU n=1 Tax=Peribacillus faecalis TaxID=2772559 RepID=A0A927HB27_9BACI|nr:YdiU family protein [Peribacillus faecalis]MBD3108051.1 YdiU family protein [Peribacillus faecalis]